MSKKQSDEAPEPVQSQSEANSQDGKPVPATRGPCPISREAFFALAKPLKVEVEDAEGTVYPLAVALKTFSTGSFGWYFQGKLPFKVGEHILEVQIGLNMTVIGSGKVK